MPTHDMLLITRTVLLQLRDEAHWAHTKQECSRLISAELCIFVCYKMLHLDCQASQSSCAHKVPDVICDKALLQAKMCGDTNPHQDCETLRTTWP